VDVGGGELTLKVKAASPRQPDIEDQAGGPIRPSGLEELIYRSEQRCMQSEDRSRAPIDSRIAVSSSMTITVEIASAMVSSRQSDPLSANRHFRRDPDARLPHV